MLLFKYFQTYLLRWPFVAALPTFQSFHKGVVVIGSHRLMMKASDLCLRTMKSKFEKNTYLLKNS